MLHSANANVQFSLAFIMLAVFSHFGPPIFVQEWEGKNWEEGSWI